MKLATIISIASVAALCVACMTPRQSDAALVVQQLYQDGVLTREQFEALMSALHPATWVNDLIAIASGLLGGGGAYIATNIRRDRARMRRGEPVVASVATPTT